VIVLIGKVTGTGLTVAFRRATPKFGSKNSAGGLVQAKLDRSDRPIVSENGDQRGLVQDLLAVLECPTYLSTPCGHPSDPTQQLPYVEPNSLMQRPILPPVSVIVPQFLIGISP
jgi:hypothetical protein